MIHGLLGEVPRIYLRCFYGRNPELASLQAKPRSSLSQGKRLEDMLIKGAEERSVALNNPEPLEFTRHTKLKGFFEIILWIII